MPLQGVEHNSEAGLQAVSQGRGRAGYADMTAAETIAAQRCLRNSACSKPLGHAGFCDSGKSSTCQKHNSLAGLAAAAEQASHALPGTHSWSLCISVYITCCGFEVCCWAWSSTQVCSNRAVPIKLNLCVVALPAIARGIQVLVHEPFTLCQYLSPICVTHVCCQCACSTR